VIYSPTLTALRAAVEVHAFAHITGGGLPGNVHRILPADGDARITRGVWPEPRIFAEVQRAGGVADTEMASVFNLGVGMVAAVAASDAARAVEVVEAAGLGAWVIGEIGPGTGRVLVETP
jgi:phosphoribosylformylglycinamidine cyclo-ligase